VRRALSIMSAAALLVTITPAIKTPVNVRIYRYQSQWGTEGKGDGQFYYPNGVALAPNGNVYVADRGNSRVQYFTPGGLFLGKWGSYGSGDGQFIYCSAVDVNSNGNVYVADPGNHRVQYFTSAGSFLGKWGTAGEGDGQFRRLESLAVAPTTRNVYTVEEWTDPGTPEVYNYRIQYFSETGRFLGAWPTVATPGYRSGPVAISVRPDGTVFGASNSHPTDVSRRVRYYSPTGSYRGGWGAFGHGPGLFSSPVSIEYSAYTDSVFVGDTQDRIQVFTPTGSYITAWGSNGSGNGQFRSPVGIAARRLTDGVFVCDRGNHRIQYFASPRVLVPLPSSGRRIIAE